MMKKWIVFAILFLIIGITTGISFNASAQQTSSSVPNWVKSISGWWSEGKISDEEYLNATQFLVNSGIIKIPLIIDLQNQIASLKSQLYNANLEIASLKNQTISSQSSVLSSSNPPTTSSPSENPTTLDLKKTNLDWYSGKITDQEFVEQLQTMINGGQIQPYTEPSREALTTKLTSQTNIPEQIPSLGYITQGDKNELLRQANADMINTGYLRYWFSEMCAAGSITGDCLIVFQELGSHTMYTPGSGPNNIPTDNATAAREKAIVIQWATNNMTDQDFINQILPFFYNGTVVYPAQDFKTVKTPTQPIPDILKDQAGFYAEGSISEPDWRNSLLAALYHIGYLHNP